MLHNFLSITLRHLWNNRLYSFINIAGLATGMACALLAILYVQDEMSYDKFHKKASQLYRITTSITNADGSTRITGATGQVQGPAFKAAIPEIQDYVRVYQGGDVYNLINGQKALAVQALYTDESFFNVFTFPLLHGNPASALDGLHSIVLSEKTAMRFFGKTDVVGQVMKLEEGKGIENFVITGVAKEAPENSSIQFEALLPFKYMQTMFNDDAWLNFYLSTFIVVNPNADIQKVKQKLSTVFQANATEQLKQANASATQYKFGLQPINNIHLGIFDNASSGSIGNDGALFQQSTLTYSYILTGIVMFILLMVCVNFLNLSIAGSLKRSKEIGVRKISGASRNQIVRRFLSEAAIICGIAFTLAIVLTGIFLPVFNRLAQKNIKFSFQTNPALFLYGLALVVVCVLLAGLYPAIRLSLFNPLQVLYNKQKLTGKNMLGKGLIVLQFTLGVSLMIACIVYYRQMNFIAHYKLGYNMAGIVEVNLPPQRVSNETINAFRNELAKQPSINQMANGDMVATDEAQVTTNGNKIAASLSRIDSLFIPTLQIPIKEGRNFSGSFAGDASHSIIVNETFVKELGLTNAVGKQITLVKGVGADENKTIIGVVKDYHNASLKEKITPLVLEQNQNLPETVWIKINTGRVPRALAAIAKTYQQIFPGHYYQYAFLDEENASQYSNDERWKTIITYAAAFAILICCTGLFGLAHFAAQQRVKEIGIRKVLGASVTNIAGLLSKDFLKLVIIAIIIASPIAWYCMHTWLENFAYKTTISFWVFSLAGVMSVLVVLCTVGLQAIKAATANPVESLRTE